MPSGPGTPSPTHRTRTVRVAQTRSPLSANSHHPLGVAGGYFRDWTLDFSHCEILRTGYDETLQIDPNNLQFLYQGDNPAANAPSYSQIPWQLGLATATSN